MVLIFLKSNLPILSFRDCAFVVMCKCKTTFQGLLATLSFSCSQGWPCDRVPVNRVRTRWLPPESLLRRQLVYLLCSLLQTLRSCFWEWGCDGWCALSALKVLGPHCRDMAPWEAERHPLAPLCGGALMPVPDCPHLAFMGKKNNGVFVCVFVLRRLLLSQMFCHRWPNLDRPGAATCRAISHNSA